MGIYNLGGGGGAPVLEARTVTPSTSQQIIKPSRDEYDGLSQVTVEATPLETRTVNPSTSSQTITPSGSNIGFSTITVNPYRLQSKSVTPSTVPYTVSPDSGYNGLSGVTFGRDSNLTSNNLAKNTIIYGVTGVLAPHVEKSYNITCTDQTKLEFSVDFPQGMTGIYALTFGSYEVSGNVLQHFYFGGRVIGISIYDVGYIPYGEAMVDNIPYCGYCSMRIKYADRKITLGQVEILNISSYAKAFVTGRNYYLTVCFYIG